MSLGLSRALLRRHHLLARPARTAFRRPASTTAEAAKTAGDVAAAAKEKVAPVAERAQDGIARVASSAGDVAGRVGSATAAALGGIGGRTGRLIGVVQSECAVKKSPVARRCWPLAGLIPPTIYYSRVAMELSKIVFRQRQMSPPYVCESIGQPTLWHDLYSSVEVFQSYLNGYLQFLRNPSSMLSAVSSTSFQAMNPLRVLRSFSYQQLAAAGVILAEVIGFFTVGEIIGKFKIIGYRSSEVKHNEGI
jgi:F-type H+-transporting ATPase subunit g